MKMHASRPLPVRRQLASDNHAGICPAAMRAMAEANAGHASPYGDDVWTARACDRIRELFETDCEVFFVYNGTAANALALAAMTDSYHGVICHTQAHIETSECGAPEFFMHGAKLLKASGEGGKLTPSAVESVVHARDELHFPRPRALSVTQVTEQGSVYSVDELVALGLTARKHSLHMHMDGARFANAVAALGVAPRELTWEAGVDALSFGGTKNGLSVGEAVVFFNRELAHEFDVRCKQAGQLLSKLRHISASWVGLLESGAWLDNARHANTSAQRLAAELTGINGVRVVRPPESNAVFLEMSAAHAEARRGMGWRFGDFRERAGGYRLMCAWDTRDEEILALVRDLKAITLTP